MPVEGKQKLAAAGTALDAELTPLVDWMRSAGCGAGPVGGDRGQQDALPDEPPAHAWRPTSSCSARPRSAATPRPSARRSIPAACLQERLHGAAYYFARYGFELAEELTAQAANRCPGHTALWL